MEGSELMLAHQSCDPMLATRFAGLTEIQQDPPGAVDALAGRERGADQAKQSGVFLRVVRIRLCEPRVVTARGDTEQATHDLHAALLSIRPDEQECGFVTAGGARPCRTRRPGPAGYVENQLNRLIINPVKSASSTPPPVCRAAASSEARSLRARRHLTSRAPPLTEDRKHSDE